MSKILEQWEIDMLMNNMEKGNGEKVVEDKKYFLLAKENLKINEENDGKHYLLAKENLRGNY